MGYRLTYSEYSRGLEEGRLLGLVCNNCGAATCPPLAVCTSCGGQDQRVAEMSGRGTIRTFTVVRVAPEGRVPPYVVAMVELDEGPWVMGNVEDISPDKADMSLIGKKVRIESRPVQSKFPIQENQRSLTFSVI
jgi:uncharacterized OB-fold protein